MNAEKKAVVHGIPGEQARARGVLRAFVPLLSCVFLTGILLGLAAPRIPLAFVGFGLLAVAALLVWNVRDGFRSVNAFFKGARGEERIALLLEYLSPGYHVFHDVVYEGGNSIDHVVVGPGGCFSIETKCWEGRVTYEAGGLFVDGKSPTRSPIQQAKASASALDAFVSARLPSVPRFQPLVCFASNTWTEPPIQVDGVMICNASDLATVILGHAEAVSPDDCERIVKLMEQKAHE